MIRASARCCLLISVLLLTAGACSSDEPSTEAESSEGSVAEEGSTEEAPEDDSHAGEWSYEGETGPANWGSLDEEYALCGTGAAQSPIDLTAPALGDITDTVLGYQPTSVIASNNGHTVQFDTPEGGAIEIDGASYELVQFHFHTPSEHVTDGASHAGELHLVHADPAGNLAVIGILLDEGAASPVLEPLLAAAPAEVADPADAGLTVDPAELVPADHSFYRYDGSLTTPPCSEGVIWSVVETPLELSSEQLTTLSGILQQNNRPVQPLGERTLHQDELTLDE